jgi:hypothetical protein
MCFAGNVEVCYLSKSIPARGERRASGQQRGSGVYGARKGYTFAGSVSGGMRN